MEHYYSQGGILKLYRSWDSLNSGLIKCAILITNLIGFCSAKMPKGHHQFHSTSIHVSIFIQRLLYHYKEI